MASFRILSLIACSLGLKLVQACSSKLTGLVEWKAKNYSIKSIPLGKNILKFSCKLLLPRKLKQMKRNLAWMEFPKPFFFFFMNLSNMWENPSLERGKALPRTTSEEACGTEVRPNLELQEELMFKSKALEINQNKVLFYLIKSLD